MGDGAFSNVYKAVDRKTGRKVAVKVVRKYEMNHSQVSFLSVIVGCVYISTSVPPPTPGPGWEQGGTRPIFCLLFPFALFCSALDVAWWKHVGHKTDGGEGKQTSQRKVQEEAKSHRGSSSFLLPFLHSLAVAGPRASGVCRIPLPPFLFSLPLWQLFVALRLAPPFTSVDHVLTGTASQHPQRGADHARYRPPQCRQASQLFRERRVLLPGSRM
jgi:serine/threonine protein kinase